MKGVIICCFLALIPSFTQGILNTYVYEFGDDVGYVIYNYKGKIPLLHKTTKKTISVPRDTDVTYVKVTVEAIAPPKVDYDPDTYVVTIKYSWAEISMSTYSIKAKGINTI